MKKWTMKKKWGTMLLATALVSAVGLTGCSSDKSASGNGQGGNKQGNASTSSTAEKKPIQIDFWYSLKGKNGETVEALVKKFNETQKDIVVKAAYQGNYYENHAKVMSAIAAGNQPDVTMIEIASTGSFADTGALEDLTSYSQQPEAKFNDYVKGLLGNSYWKDKLYTIPFNRSTPLLYLNKKMVQDAGLDPSGPKNWDELAQYARTLTKKEGNQVVRYGFETPIDIWFYEALVFENGGEILSKNGKEPRFNSPEGVAPISFWTSMMKEGTMKMPPGEKYNAWDVTENDFVNGTVGMIFTSTGSLGGLTDKAPFEVATAFLPAKKDYGVPTGGANLAILAKSPQKEKDAAWKFIQFVTNTENTAYWSQQTGYMPVRESAFETDTIKKLFAAKPQFKVAKEQLQYGRPRPMVPGYKELQEIIMTEIQRAILGQATPEEALNNAAEKAKKLLK